jgi:hypothetical protein
VVYPFIAKTCLPLTDILDGLGGNASESVCFCLRCHYSVARRTAHKSAEAVTHPRVPVSARLPLPHPPLPSLIAPTTRSAPGATTPLPAILRNPGHSTPSPTIKLSALLCPHRGPNDQRHKRAENPGALGGTFGYRESCDTKSVSLKIDPPPGPKRVLRSTRAMRLGDGIARVVDASSGPAIINDDGGVFIKTSLAKFNVGLIALIIQFG